MQDARGHAVRHCRKEKTRTKRCGLLVLFWKSHEAREVLVSKSLIIIGAGQFGREVFGWATQAIAHGAPWRIKGLLDSRANALDAHDYDSKIIGNVFAIFQPG